MNKYEINNLIKFFDLIRSTDAPGYPTAYLNFKNFYIEIFNAKMFKKTINAQIKISKKKILIVAAHPDDEIFRMRWFNY